MTATMLEPAPAVPKVSRITPSRTPWVHAFTEPGLLGALTVLRESCATRDVGSLIVGPRARIRLTSHGGEVVAILAPLSIVALMPPGVTRIEIERA